MDCSTIVVSYDTFELTAEAVRSAREAAPGLDHEIVVVDNASPDDSAVRLEERFPPRTHPDVRIVANEENVGFARANNQGARLASGHVLFFLNPDTVVHENAVRTLYEFVSERQGIGAVGPRVLDPDGSDQSSVSRFATPAGMIRHFLPLDALVRGRFETAADVPSDSREVDVVKGCAVAVRRDAFEEIGGWDESYFLYAEERELCWRLSEAGYRNYYLREATITHYGGAAGREKYVAHQVLQQKSSVQFLRRRHHAGLLALHRVLGTLGYGARALVFPLLARLRPDRGEELRRRGRAASALWRWFLFDHE